MLGGEIEECHEFFVVFLQAQRRIGIFGLVDPPAPPVELCGKMGDGMI